MSRGVIRRLGPGTHRFSELTILRRGGAFRFGNKVLRARPVLALAKLSSKLHGPR